jgi:hypothetical protein
MGLSVEATIDISDTRGPLLTSTLQQDLGARGVIPETLRRTPDDGTQNYHFFTPSQQTPSGSQSDSAPANASPPPATGAPPK